MRKLCVWFAHNSMIWPRCKSEYSINTTFAHVYNEHGKNTLSNYTNCAIIDFRFDFRMRPTFSFRTFFFSLNFCMSFYDLPRSYVWNMHIKLSSKTRFIHILHSVLYNVSFKYYLFRYSFVITIFVLLCVTKILTISK